jgi:hypothetical protein
MQEKLNRRILLLKNASAIKLKCPKAYGLLGHLIKIVLSVCLLDRLCFSSDEKSLFRDFRQRCTNHEQQTIRISSYLTTVPLKYRGCSIIDVHLGINVIDVGSNGSETDEELIGDVLISKALG